MKVLIVGLGGIGQRHARNLRRLLGDGLTLGAVRQRGLKHVILDHLQVLPGEDVERWYGIRHFDDLEMGLADRPDVVFVTNPTSLHVPVALAAARVGCNLFIEKPISHDERGLDELIDTVEAKGLVALVGYQLRFHPCVRLVRQVLIDGLVGHPLAARVEVGDYLPGWHRYEDYREMYASRHDLGGGVVLSQIHELDYVYHLFGLPRRLFTVGGHLSGLEIDVEDVASTVMECVVDGRPLPVHVHQDYLQRPAARTCEVIGERGRIVTDLLAASIRVFDRDGTLIVDKTFEGFQRNDMFLDEMRHLFDCLEGRVTPEVTLRNGRQSLRVALAARRSLETGDVVTLATRDNS
jgi:predicted dehydrogenase